MGCLIPLINNAIINFDFPVTSTLINYYLLCYNKVPVAVYITEVFILSKPSAPADDGPGFKFQQGRICKMRGEAPTWDVQPENH